MSLIEDSKFNYYFVVWAENVNQPLISLDPKESDFADNQKVLNALIGTLVKYGNSGKIEPYLAEKIDISTDRLNWSFKLRKGLRCEDGTLIDAPAFKRALEVRILNYAQKGSVLEFDKLIGWEEFLNGGELKGISTPDDLTMNFKFNKETDLLEFLRMPYFGFWCPGNFDGDKFKDEHTVISSGPYKLVTKSDGKNLSLVIRDDWFSVTKDSPKKINFSLITREAIHEARGPALLDLGVDSPSSWDKEKYTSIFGVPTHLSSVILNPHTGFFADANNRRKFAASIRGNDFTPGSKNRVRSNFFFMHDENKAPNVPISEPYNEREYGGKLTFALANQLSDIDLNPLKEAIIKALPGFNVEFIKPDKSIKGWRDRLMSNKQYDARIGSVNAGGAFNNIPIKMMFCTELGVRYPDPSGRICKLVNEYEAQSKLVDEEYVRRFNHIFFEDSAVVPIYFGSVSWLVGKDIDLDQLPSTVNYFQFEKIRFK